MHVEKFDWRKGFVSTYATGGSVRRSPASPTRAGPSDSQCTPATRWPGCRRRVPVSNSSTAVRPRSPNWRSKSRCLRRRSPKRCAAAELSLSEPLREDGDAELGDVVEDRGADSPFEVAATALLPEEISRLLAPLDEREREILKLRFGLDRGEPRTLEEVGEHFNLTRERIRQIEARAMSKLRHPSSDTGARDLLSV